MLPIEAVFKSISKTLGFFHPDWPSPEVQIAPEAVVGGANENHKILPKPEDRPKLSNIESSRFQLSESKSDKHNHENSPTASTFPKIQHTISSMKRRRSGLLDVSRRSATTNESNAWAHKAILSLGKEAENC